MESLLFLQPFERKSTLIILKTKRNSYTRLFFDNVDGFLACKRIFKDGREYNAMFKDGAIYLSPDQDNERDYWTIYSTS